MKKKDEEQASLMNFCNINREHLFRHFLFDTVDFIFHNVGVIHGSDSDFSDTCRHRRAYTGTRVYSRKRVRSTREFH